MNYSTPAVPAPKVTWLNVVQGAATFMKETVKNEKSVMIYLWCNEAHCDLVVYSAEVKHFDVVIAKEGVNIQVTVDCDLIWAAVCPSVYDTSVFYNTVHKLWSAELNKEKKKQLLKCKPKHQQAILLLS